MNLNHVCQTLFAFARLPIAMSCIAAACLVEPASARLGTFNSNDGYASSFFSNGYNWGDVAYYNAGDYGINAGGGPGPAFIPPDSGKWKQISNVGGFFATAALRNLYTSTAPPYPMPVTSDTAPSYLVGAHFPGRNNDNANLAFRNYNAAGTGPAVYEYYLDQYDMGTNPASITSGPISTEFYFSPNAAVPDPSGARAKDKFTLSFMDTSGNIGVQWGYAMDNEVVWRNAAGPWNYTGIYAEDQTNPNNVWDGVDITINLTTDTFSFDYYDVGTNTWSNIVPAGTPLANPMQDLTRLRWQLEDDVFAHPFFGKNYFDDFSFAAAVPEPSTAILAGLAVLSLFAKRRSRG